MLIGEDLHLEPEIAKMGYTLSLKVATLKDRDRTGNVEYSRGTYPFLRVAACRWHWEMAQLNVIARTLIRIAFGTALPSGSHADALVSYSTACQLAPHRLIHRSESPHAHSMSAL